MREGHDIGRTRASTCSVFGSSQPNHAPARRIGRELEFSPRQAWCAPFRSPVGPAKSLPARSNGRLHRARIRPSVVLCSPAWSSRPAPGIDPRSRRRTARHGAAARQTAVCACVRVRLAAARRPVMGLGKCGACRQQKRQQEGSTAHTETSVFHSITHRSAAQSLEPAVDTGRPPWHGVPHAPTPLPARAAARCQPARTGVAGRRCRLRKAASSQFRQTPC